MIRKLWPLSAAALELGMSTKALANRIADLDPDKVEETGRGTDRFWTMARIVKHLQGNDGELGGKPLDLSAERARLAAEQADKTSLENAVRRGDLLQVSDVAASWAEIFIGIKARILALPTKLATELSTLTDANEIRDRLAQEVRDLLEEGVNFDPVRAATGRDKGSTEEDFETAEAPARLNGKSVGGHQSKAKPRKQRRAGPMAH